MGPAGAGAEPEPPSLSEPEPEPLASPDAPPEPPELPEPEPEPDAEPLPADPRARLRRAAGSRGARHGIRPPCSQGASDLLGTGERRIHGGSPRCPGQRRNAQHAGAGARTKAQSCRSIGRDGVGLGGLDRHRAHRARRAHGAGLNFAHLAVKPQRRFQRDNHRAGPIAGNHGGDCRHVTADARNHQGERRGRKRHHGTGDAGLPPQPARAARRAVGSGERGRRARGRTDGAASRRRLPSRRLRA